MTRTTITPIQGAASQATVVEQSRAVAEVLAAYQRAITSPRDEARAYDRMRNACRTPDVADAAQYSYRRSGQAVTGPSIRLAETLAGCWGNIDYGTRELSRDEFTGTSELLAWATDLETNTRSSQTIVVPARSISTGKDLDSWRDERENTSNVGSRILRECILRVLPRGYIAEAIALCDETRRKPAAVGPAKAALPLPERAKVAISTYADRGIDEARLIAKHGPVADWTEATISQLRSNLNALSNDADPADLYPAVRTAESVETVDADWLTGEVS